jgi:hypothetical protein
MIIIPPTVEFEEYFTKFAKLTWTKYMLKEPDKEDEMRREHKTLCVSCDMELQNQTVSVKLHYRFIRSVLYCFVEEV